MEQKRRGRPPGLGKKKEMETQLNTTVTTEPKKRGRKAVEKLNITYPNMVMEGEIEGTITEKLKSMAIILKELDRTLDLEPYRMDIRMIKNDTIQRICYLIEGL